jgi:hypothetical protein
MYVYIVKARLFSFKKNEWHTDGSKVQMFLKAAQPSGRCSKSWTERNTLNFSCNGYIHDNRERIWENNFEDYHQFFYK